MCGELAFAALSELNGQVARRVGRRGQLLERVDFTYEHRSGRCDMAVDWDDYSSDKAEWTRKTAPMALAVMIDCAKSKNGAISYGELARLMCERYGEPIQHNKRLYGQPIGAAATAAIQISKAAGIAIPPLSVIIINQTTGYAGEGADQFIPRLAKARLDVLDPKRIRILQEEMDRVWDFGAKNWDRVQRLLGEPALPPPKSLPKRQRGAPDPGTGGGPESDAHIALKKWVATHPKAFLDFGAFTSGSNEAKLQSGDSIDAMLSNAVARLAVEVKTGAASEKELIRGIFQCVKYRHTLQAEALVFARERLPGTSVLVSTQPLPPYAQDIARSLDVRFVQVPKSAEKTVGKRQRNS